MRSTAVCTERALKTLAPILALVVAALAFAGVASASTLGDSTAPAAPWILSDLADYAPGSTVHLTGGNWQPGETITIVVNDTAGNTWSKTDDVVADANGGLVDDVTLPNSFIADYTVTATARSGSATTMFTDADVKDATLAIRTSDCSATQSGSFSSGATACARSTITALSGNASSTGDIFVMWTDPNSITTVSPQHTGAVNASFDDKLQVSVAGTWTVRVCTNNGVPCGPQQTLATAAFGVTAPAKQNQTVTFTSSAPGSAKYGDAYTPAATGGGSGNPVTFGATGACSYAGGTVTMAGIGTCTVTADQAGSATYNAAPQVTQTFSVAKASSATVVSCPSGVTYDGSAQTPCTATVTGPGGLSQSLVVGYQSNTDAGTATASASFGGDANHTASSDSKTFAIAKADSTTTVSCASGPFTYTGSAYMPCTASVTGAGGLSQSPAVGYDGNTNAGTATASASYAGDGNHKPSSDSKTFAIAKADSETTVSCSAGPITFDGSAQTPCSASVSGAGGLQASAAVGYENNTGAGTATASASYAGDGNHKPSGDSATFAIGKAASATTVSCPSAPLTYDGSAQTPCTARVTGAGNLDQTLDVTYQANTNAGTAHAAASFAGDDNHTAGNDAATFSIGRAASTTTVTCPSAALTYNGSARTPCTAEATGAGGLDQTLDVTYQANTNAGTAHAAATFAGDGNHTASSDSATFTIDKASSTTTVTCPSAALTYDGTARTPCTAEVTGAGGLDRKLDIAYQANTNAGTAHASASFAGDDNHIGSDDSAAFTIDKADVSIAIDWTASTYDGTPNPATATVSGPATAENPITAPALTYTYYRGSDASGTALGGAPVDADTYTVSAAFAGTGNYNAKTATKTIAIAKAASSTSVTCPSNALIYNGSARTPCTAEVTGAGGLDLELSVDYVDNTDAGTARANASYDGDGNHKASSDSATFTIEKAPATTTVTCPSAALTYDGSARTPCSAEVTGAGGLDQELSVDYTDNTNAGTAHAAASFAGDGNHTADTGSATFTIAKAPSTTKLSCPSTSLTYDGSAQTPCTAKVTGAGGLDHAVSVSYSANTNAGTAHAAASFAGDDNHTGSDDAATFQIDQAGSATTVSCPADPLTYNGSARTPCTARVTGAGGLDRTLDVTYQANTNAGTAHATAAFGGDANHTASGDSAAFTIAKADVSIAIGWAASTFDGTANAATATVSGPVTAENPITAPAAVLTYYDGSNAIGTALGGAPKSAGTYTVSASFAGSGNYNGKTATKTITIAKAASTTAVTCPSTALYTGSPVAPCTAAVTGPGGLSRSLTLTYADNIAPGASTASASAAFDGDADHTASSDSKRFSIVYGAAAVQFLQPINGTAHTQSAEVSTFKAGSTVPVKVQVKLPNGTIVKPASAAWLTPQRGGMTTQPVDTSVYTDPADSGASYAWSIDGFSQYNWGSAKTGAGSYWLIGVRLDDGQTYTVYISLK